VFTYAQKNWKRFRNIINPAFHMSWDTNVFGELTRQMVEKVEDRREKPVAIHSWLQKYDAWRKQLSLTKTLQINVGRAWVDWI
jgi:hypothetical protein